MHPVLFQGQSRLRAHCQGNNLVIDWLDWINYAFPTLLLLLCSLHKLQQERVIVIPIAPFWPRQFWFPLLPACQSILHAFLITITSARMVGEWGTMMATPHSFTRFHKHKDFLRLHPRFLPKVVSCFYLNQSIHLHAFFLKLHASE